MVAMVEHGLRISIEGEEVRDGVPLSLLADVFRGVQETVYYIAMAELRYNGRRKVHVPSEILNEYRLIRVAEHNSVYTADIALARPRHMRLPLETDRRTAVMDKYLEFLRILSAADSQAVSELSCFLTQRGGERSFVWWVSSWGA
ncbi:MAG: hypothetical protein HPY71_00080 [Firmicutes bacterium]|nr:hypothetical protein [Bacillota bacterium]